MKTGQVPIHIMRWAPADYVNDPFVRRSYQRRDYRTAAFYPAFLFWCHIEGGSLPSDPEDLAAIVLMPRRDVEYALGICKAAGKIQEQDGRLTNKRVTAEIARELEFRAGQAVSGKRGAQARINKDSPRVAQATLEDSARVAKPVAVAGRGGGEALAGRGVAAEPPPAAEKREPAIDVAAVDDLEAAQVECKAELEQTHRELGIPRDELMWECSGTDRGRRIGRIDTCTSAGWLRTTAQKLREKRVEARVGARAAPPPGKQPTLSERNEQAQRDFLEGLKGAGRNRRTAEGGRMVLGGAPSRGGAPAEAGVDGDAAGVLRVPGGGDES